jgi:sulfur carrier protein ThiS adenylyltransferase
MSERYSRQVDLVPEKRLASRKVTVIGVGAIGRQIALQLAAMGVQHIQLIDHDIVEESNIASQGYWEKDLGESKVGATGYLCLEINSQMRVEMMPRKFDPEIDFGETVFCCVDSITTRKQIWEVVGEAIDFFCDGRMAAESLRILTAYSIKSGKSYSKTFFSQREAYRGSCTAKTTIYCANVIAGIMVAQFAKFLRNIPVETDIFYNLQANELTISEAEKGDNLSQGKN